MAADGAVAADAAAGAAQPSHDPAEMIGEWWARLYDPETLQSIVAGLMSLLFVIVIVAVVYLAMMVVFARALRRVERDAEQAAQPRRRRSQRIVTVLALVRSISKWVIFIAGGVWALAVLGLNVAPVLAGAGIVGLAVGFGAQNLVRDLVSGFFILLEGQYAVGDYAQIGPMFGMVESIGMRVTVLLDLDNQRHYIPNGGITTVTVYEEPFANHVIEVPIADAAQAGTLAGELTALAASLKEEYPHHLVYYRETSSVEEPGGALVRLPVASFPTQEWLINEEIPGRVTELLAREQIALQEGRKIRVYMDLSRMPTYDMEADQVQQVSKPSDGPNPAR